MKLRLAVLVGAVVALECGLKASPAEDVAAGVRKKLPAGWTCTLITGKGKMGHPHGLGEPLFRLDFTNTTETFQAEASQGRQDVALHPSLRLHFHARSEREAILRTIRAEEAYPDIPVWVMETNDYVVVTSPGWQNLGNYSDAANGSIDPLWRALEKYFGRKMARGQWTSVLYQDWFELESPNFNCYSCGETQKVCLELTNLLTKLEQFRQAFANLASTEAVASPPVIVLAFPDLQRMRPFLPLYGGKPAAATAFAQGGEDENMIVLSLKSPDEDILHEYTHLLFRHNERFWPVWLIEGMAQIYSTFRVPREQPPRIAELPSKLRRSDTRQFQLSIQEFMPLSQLLGVKRDSPEYNEKDLQRVFYAESWLLTHYLMNGNRKRLAQFRRYSPLLKVGETSEQAFIHAFEAPLSVIETELRQYLQRGQFEPQRLTLSNAPGSGQELRLRRVRREETCFRIGYELMRLNRTNEARAWFEQGREINPASPFPYEGLGLLADKGGRPKEAARAFTRAFESGSSNFVAHCVYAGLAVVGDTNRAAVSVQDAREHLQIAVSLMANSAQPHFVMGRLELDRKGDPAKAEQHLRRATELSPGNPFYTLWLAMAQKACGKTKEARTTLQELLRPYVPDGLRQAAEQLLKALDVTPKMPALDTSRRLPAKRRWWMPTLGVLLLVVMWGSLSLRKRFKRKR